MRNRQTRARLAAVAVTVGSMMFMVAGSPESAVFTYDNAIDSWYV
jgi:hypothetical protein